MGLYNVLQVFSKYFETTKALKVSYFQIKFANLDTLNHYSRGGGYEFDGPTATGSYRPERGILI